MDSQDQRSGVSYLTYVLRRVTRATQVAPFIYVLGFAIYLLLCWAIPDGAAWWIDKFCYIGYPFIAGFLLLSRILRLCAWHKTACLIPLSARVECFIDQFVFQFTQNEIILINTLIGILSLAFIIMAYLHFFSNGRKSNRP